MTPEREAFLSSRLTGIGGSDIASLLNEGYGCRRRLWYQKTGAEPDEPKRDTAAMKLGRWLEPYIAQEYEQETGRTVEEVGLQRHDTLGMLIVHVDRLITSSHRPDKGVLEIKAMGSSAWYEARRGGLVVDYILQVQHGMLCTGLQWGAYAILNRDTGALMQWDVEPDPRLQDLIRAEGPVFWATVENGPAPERLSADDKRCKRCEFAYSCQGAALLAMAEGGQSETFVPALAPLMERYVEALPLFKEAEALVEGIEGEIADAMGDRQEAQTVGGRITFRAYDRKGYSVKATVIRALRIYPVGGRKKK